MAVERVAFLIEDTGERVGCMLNPETLLVQRVAGVRPRRPGGSLLGVAGLGDEPLLFTGGGSTRLTLDLLFDVTLPGSSILSDDVRALTAPLWALAENAGTTDRCGRPPRVRFVWGKTWNVPGVVGEIAERLEAFGADGAPRRSWIRLRFLRAAERDLPKVPEAVPGEDVEGALEPAAPAPPETLPADLRVHEVSGGAAADGDEAGGVGDRLDLLAWRYLGNAALWRRLAALNGIDDPSRLEAGRILRVPDPGPGGVR